MEHQKRKVVMTFRQQLILMIADKLVIAATIGAFVYYAQKRLERYRTRQKRAVHRCVQHALASIGETPTANIAEA